MKSCKKCGAPLDAKAKFCTECGAKAQSGHTALFIVLGIVPVLAAFSFLMPAEPRLPEDGWYNYGYAPCFVNGEEKQLVLCWTDKEPDGYVVGYREVTDAAEYSAKGVLPLNNGNTIDFIADYYTDDGEYYDWHYLGDTLVYDGTALTISYEDVGDAPCLVFYMLTDIYQSNYYTQAIEFSF